MCLMHGKRDNFGTFYYNKETVVSHYCRQAGRLKKDVRNVI